MVSPVTIKNFTYKGTTIRDLGGKNQKSNLVVFITKTEKRTNTHGSRAKNSAETNMQLFPTSFLKTLIRLKPDILIFYSASRLLSCIETIWKA